ncbi:MAG: hypothetical protein M9898_14710, partial [Chitinophagaceae bacterium]|nr:hypothetical protein [Chitinophagaceae bacterium]
MLDIELLKNDKDNEWLVRQFEAYRFNDTMQEDKFFPRPYISIIFHFKDCAHISGESSQQLEPFFVAPIIPQAIILKFKGKLDT